VLDATGRRDRLDALIEEAAADGEFAAVVRRLACLRGIDTLTGFGLAVEIGDWERFTGRSIGCFVGLVPSEDSSGERDSRGPLTKTGNQHARRLLIEAAWHHRKPYRPTQTLRARWAKSTPAAARRGDQGNRRLHRRWARFDARSKKPVTANAAIARELAGWCWSLAVMD
jgi:transposase